MHDLDIITIVFAILAVFVIWKLRSVLGTRTGAERPPPEMFAQRAKVDPAPERSYPHGDDNKIIRLPGAAHDAAHDAANDPGVPSAPRRPPDPNRWKAYAEPGSKLWAGLDAIEADDPTFEPGAFVAGAKGAYEMVVTAFAAGDRKTLKNLLAKDVYDNFSNEISGRESRGEKAETTFVSIDKAAIEDAQMRADHAQVAVRFHSKLITATRDKAGTVIDGSAEKVVDMVDVWTFARDVHSHDPNWRLVSTDTGH